ncbi:hypothetical protein AXF42_Ash016422 [Apostasia shenzhenica]|uniref:Uncharacterized protein n=1 Tax=Apostasia shenzhenica TaxID=1088818 RepID=A0A2I0A034_9ASPA|nr:hypothetical protein AXF42_Ash016422 [Apostasia shenzhenica]
MPAQVQENVMAAQVQGSVTAAQVQGSVMVGPTRSTGSAQMQGSVMAAQDELSLPLPDAESRIWNQGRRGRRCMRRWRDLACDAAREREREEKRENHKGKNIISYIFLLLNLSFGPSFTLPKTNSSI